MRMSIQGGFKKSPFSCLRFRWLLEMPNKSSVFYVIVTERE